MSNPGGGGWDSKNFLCKVSYLVVEFPIGAAGSWRKDRTRSRRTTPGSPRTALAVAAEQRQGAIAVARVLRRQCLSVTDEFTKEGLAIDVDGRIRSNSFIRATTGASRWLLRARP
jgi:hypothetical protein